MNEARSLPPSEGAGSIFGVVGILLAAGRGRRFDPSGEADKLQQPLPSGETVAEASARTLLAVLPRVLAVVREEGALAQRLRALGCETTVCPDADSGMATSLVHGIGATREADAWLIALADMPFVQSGTLLALADALNAGADIAVPVYGRQRGNPVAFSRRHLDALLALEGDRGARHIVVANPVAEVPVQDPGIHLDIDTPASLTLTAKPNSPASP